VARKPAFNASALRAQHPALRTFLAVSKQQGLARAQVYVVRTGAEDLQDHLFVLYLGFAPGLQALHDAAADLLWESGRLAGFAAASAMPGGVLRCAHACCGCRRTLTP